MTPVSSVMYKSLLSSGLNAIIEREDEDVPQVMVLAPELPANSTFLNLLLNFNLNMRLTTM